MGRALAIRYVILFVAFWAATVAAIVTRSNQLRYVNADCPVTPRHPWLLVTVLLLAALFFVASWELTHDDRGRRDRHIWIGQVRWPVSFGR